MTSGRYELHCHLDGSVRPDTIAELAVEAGIELAGPVRARAVAPPDVGSLHAFLSYPTSRWTSCKPPRRCGGPRASSSRTGSPTAWPMERPASPRSCTAASA